MIDCNNCPHKLGCLIIMGKQNSQGTLLNGRLKRKYDDCYKIIQKIFKEKNSRYAWGYTVSFLGERWLEAEEIIKQDKHSWQRYCGEAFYVEDIMRSNNE